MKLTHNEDYTVITLESTSLDFVDTESVVLKSTIDCGTTTYTSTITSATDGVFTVDLDDLYGTTDLQDGVYSFVLEITKTDESLIKDYSCMFVDKTIKCQVAECVKDKQNLELQLDYYIISRATDCECSCEDLCTIYKRLKHELESCQSC